ncbi:hypothetical protein BAE44_0016727 [Dichanthelium oligosanthes]|uniref:Knottin scorpion toxin-like domain-containing protein n=1 Tax=Dichanthelium oligosanthes TaxID=888268 RepID=A0A1E5VAY1_9POAL|nr:hypothetical protein BAE44_0016727 [Dichanthelium oligosanthes]
MASSKKTLAFLVALLLMALVAAAVPAGRRSFLLEAERCSASRYCKPDTCGATCAVLGFNGVGVCKVDGGVPSCCCVPKPSTSTGIKNQIVLQ